MAWITKEGRTVEEARDAAVAAAGRAVDDLEIEVVNEGAKGLFGLGGEPAVVRVRPKTEATDVRGAFRDDITPASRDDAEPGRGEARREPRRDRAPQTPPSEVADVDDDIEVTDDGADAVDDDEDGRPLSERQHEAADLGTEIIRGILERMDLEGEIKTRIAGGTVYIEVFGDEMGILI